MANKSLPEYTYRDYGSLVSLGKYSTIGNMMGGLSKGSIKVEGLLARMMYLSLYKMPPNRFVWFVSSRHAIIVTPL